MPFKTYHTITFDKDINTFQRKHFEHLHTLLRTDEDGNHFEKCSFQKSKLKNLDLSGLDVSNFDFSGSVLKQIDFTGCNLNNTTFEKATLTHCRFDGSRMEHISFEDATLEDCNFSNVTIGGTMRWVKLKNCTFSRVNFACVLHGTDFRANNLEHIDYREARDLSGVMFPPGF